MMNINTTANNTYAGAWSWLVAIALVQGVVTGASFSFASDGFNWLAFVLGTVGAGVLFAPVVMAFWVSSVHASVLSDQLELNRQELKAIRAAIKDLKVEAAPVVTAPPVLNTSD